GLAVLTPLLAQHPADLPQGRLGARRCQDRLDEVRRSLCGRDDIGQRTLDGGAVAVGAAASEHGVLLAFDVAGDAQDLQVGGDGVVEFGDADDVLGAVFELLLVGEGGLGDLGVEPAVLDALEDAGGDGADVVAAAGSHGGPGDRCGGLAGLAAEGVGDVEDAGLVAQDGLGAEGDLGGLVGGEGEGLVEGVGVQG
ncbi:hypothetical protein ADL26_04335, partial [Thermoactinomyces vulgaris]